LPCERENRCTRALLSRCRTSQSCARCERPPPRYPCIRRAGDQHARALRSPLRRQRLRGRVWIGTRSTDLGGGHVTRDTQPNGYVDLAVRCRARLDPSPSRQRPCPRGRAAPLASAARPRAGRARTSARAARARRSSLQPSALIEAIGRTRAPRAADEHRCSPCRQDRPELEARAPDGPTLLATPARSSNPPRRARSQPGLGSPSRVFTQPLVSYI
jgi:hypothetical protein